MAEYDDRGDDYGDYDYDDPSEYENYDWQNYDDRNIEDVIKEYDQKLNELDQEYKKKKNDNTRGQVQSEIDRIKNIRRFLDNLRKFRRKWNPKPDQIQATKSCIGVLEKELKDLNSSLRRCRKQDSINERKRKIKLLTQTITYYKKSLALIGEKQAPKSSPSSKPPARKSTKPAAQKLPDEKEWSALGEASGLLKSALGYGWWGTKGIVRGTAGAVQGVAKASAVVGNAAIEGGKLAAEGGSSLYSTFRENTESQEKVSRQHEEIDRETEQKNERTVTKIRNIVPPSSDEFFNAPTEELKTHVENLAIEKNNLEGEKRKEEVRRQENEKLCREEEARRIEENKKREEENKKREAEEKLRKEEELKRENIQKKLINLGKGISENEKIRIEEEDIRQEQENIRQLNENERQMKEDTRQIFENLRQEDEKIRQTLDNNRKIYWETMLEEKEKWLEKMGHNNDVFQKLMDALVADDKRRRNLDETISVNEDKRIGNETTRLENEKDRREAEEERIKNENIRIENERARINAELERVTGEKKREEQEQNRIEEEEKRFINEEERIANEKARVGREKISIASEKQRVDNEKRRENFYTSKLEKIPEEERKRVESEKGRKEREQIFQENEKQRIMNEKIRISNDERRKFIQEQNLKLLEERANKLDNIELKFSKKQKIEEPKKTFETYFTNEENTTEWIEDQRLKKKVEDILKNIDEEEKTPQTYSNALLDGIEQMENVNLSVEWEKRIIKEEKEKLKWRQKINALNEALLEKNIVLTDNDLNIKEFYDKNLKHSETSKNELNGFYFGDIKVIKRTTQKTFVINTSKVAQEKVNEFIAEIKKLNTNADTIISNEVGLFADSEINREFAESYIRELREEQKEMIRNGTLENGEFFEMEEFNEINREIEDIRKNKKFKIRPKIWARSFGGFVSRFVKYLKLVLKRHFKLLIGLFLTGIGATSTSLILENFLRKAGYKIGEIEKNLPKNLKNLFSKTLPEILKKYLGNYYGYYLGAFFSVIAVIFRGIVFGFTKSVVTLSADIIGGMGKLVYVLYSSLGLVGLWAGSSFFGTVGYFSYKIYEESFYMSNEMPPDEIIERRAEDENMSKEKYKKQFVTPNRFYNSNLAKLMSYPVSAASYGAGKASDKGKETLDWMSHWGIVVGVLGGIVIFVELLIKWRK